MNRVCGGRSVLGFCTEYLVLSTQYFRAPSSLRLSFALSLLAILVGFLTSPQASAKDSRPNILFIMSDDHGYQAISAYGSKVEQDAEPRSDGEGRDAVRPLLCDQFASAARAGR